MSKSDGNDRPRKRQRFEQTTNIDSEADTASDLSTESETEGSVPAKHDASAARPSISPPPVLRAKVDAVPTTASAAQVTASYMPTPVQLTSIRDLPDAANVDTISLRDILNDPMIKEQWQFNFLHDVDFIM